MNPIFLSLFDSATDNVPKLTTLPWGELVALMTRHKPVRVAIPDDIEEDDLKDLLDRVKKDYPCFSPCIYREGATRAKKNVEQVFAFVADIDDGTPLADLEPLWVNKDGEPLAHIWFTTFKSRASKPRIRVFFPLAAPVAGADWLPVWRRLSKALTAGHNDENTKDASRLHFLPACPEVWLSEADCGVREGAPVDPADYPEAAADPTPQPVEARPTVGFFAQVGRFVQGAPMEWDLERDGDPSVDDDALLRWLSRCRNGPKFDALMRGDTSGHGGDESAADMALASMIARVVGDDAARVERLFERSHLAQRDKWTQRPDYRSRTIQNAIALRAGDFFDLAKWVKGRAARQSAAAAAEQLDPGPHRPVVVVNGRQDRDVSEAALAALVDANQAEEGGRPTLYNRFDRIVALVPDGARVRAANVGEDMLAHILRRVADYATERTAKGGEMLLSPARLPNWLAMDILSDPTAAGRLPRLSAVVTAPVVTEDGRVLATPGYDAASGIYHAGDLVPVPTAATREEAKAAAARLMSLFDDFPYASKGDRANAAALLFTPFLRNHRPGPAPLFMVEAPTPGTGKTLLATSLLEVSSPGIALTGGPSERERGAAEEWEKLLGATLSSSPSAVLFDNLRGTIESSALEMIVTATGPVTLRVLGTSTTMQVDTTRTTLAATGNNAEFRQDGARRVVFIRLDAGMEDPSAREGFRISDLLAHIGQNRGRILADVALVLRAWTLAGCPRGSARKASFDGWAGAVGGLLEFVGIDGFLTTDADRAAAADPETVALRAFFAAWWETFGDRPVSSRELVERTGEEVTAGGIFTRSLPGLAMEYEIVPEGGRSPVRALGKKLQAMRDKVYGEFRLTAHEDGHTKTLRWKLSRVEQMRGLQGLRGFATGHAGERKTADSSETRETHMREGLHTNPADSANPAPVLRGVL